MYDKNLVLTYDGYIYLEMARNMVLGKGITLGEKPHLFHSPLYPALIAMCHKLTGLELTTTSNLLCMVFLICNVMLIMYFCRKYLRSKSMAVWAVIIYLGSERVQRYGISNFSENVLTPLYTLAFLFAFRIILKSKYTFLNYAGITMALSAAYYAKPEALIVYFCIMGFLFLHSVIRRHDLIKTLGRIFISLAMFSAIISPYVYYLYNHTHKLMLSGKTNAILYWTQWKQDGLFAPHEFQNRFIDGYTIEEGFMRASNCDFPGYDINVPFIIKNLIVPLEFTFQFFGLGFTLILLVSLFDSRKWKSIFFLLPFSVIALVFFSFLLLYSYPRFILPLTPWFAVYLAYEFRRLFHGMKSIPWRYTLVGMCLFLEFPFLWLFRSDFVKPMSESVTKTIPYQEMDMSKKIVTNHIDYAYYNGMSNTFLLPLNIHTENELTDYVDRCEVDTVIIEAAMNFKNEEYIERINDNEIKKLKIIQVYSDPQHKRVTWILIK